MDARRETVMEVIEIAIEAIPVKVHPILGTELQDIPSYNIYLCYILRQLDALLFTVSSHRCECRSEKMRKSTTARWTFFVYTINVTGRKYAEDWLYALKRAEN